MTDKGGEHARAWYDRVLNMLVETGAITATLGLAAIVTMYCIEIFSRYLLNAPTTWASDFIVFTLCASIFLMMPEVTRSGGHVAVTLLTDMLPEQAQQVARRTLTFVGFCICLFAAYISLQANLDQYFQGLQTVTTITTPKWLITMFITYGLLVSALEFLRQTLAGKPIASAATIG